MRKIIEYDEKIFCWEIFIEKSFSFFAPIISMQPSSLHYWKMRMRRVLEGKKVCWMLLWFWQRFMLFNAVVVKADAVIHFLWWEISTNHHIWKEISSISLLVSVCLFKNAIFLFSRGGWFFFWFFSFRGLGIYITSPRKLLNGHNCAVAGDKLSNSKENSDFSKCQNHYSKVSMAYCANNSCLEQICFPLKIFLGWKFGDESFSFVQKNFPHFANGWLSFIMVSC